MTKVLTADLIFDAADHVMQTLGAQAWDARDGMIDLFDGGAARSASISQELVLNFIAQHVLGLPSHRAATRVHASGSAIRRSAASDRVDGE